MKAAVYTGTKNLYKEMLAAAKSLLIHSNVEKIYFLIEDDNFPYKLPSEIETINVKNQTFFIKEGPNFNTSWTYMVLMRAALSKVFPNLDKILSLDVDTIVNEDISNLWDINIDDYYLAAVREPCKSSENFMYINAGVMMFNLNKIRQDHKDDEIIHKLNTIKYEYNEQDCISESFQNKIFELLPDYNVENWSDYSRAKHRKISHFAAVKDWQKLPIIDYYFNAPIFKPTKSSYLLDIIIPAYNDAEGLRRTLNSVYYPEHKDWVTITVVNDCSTENLDYIIADYPGISYIVCSENGGPGVARNIGMASTINPYITFIDCGDILFSKYSLYEIKDAILSNTMADIHQFPWINGEWNTISVENSRCTPGMIYRRDFLNLYNIRYCSDPNGAYSNEDVGFNHKCHAILSHIETYDRSPHLEFHQVPIYKMVLNKESLTHKNGNYLYTKQIPGLVTNAIHCIKFYENSNIAIEVLLAELNDFMVALYHDYLYCIKKYPELEEQYLIPIREFYNNCYKKYENNSLNDTYLSSALGYKMKSIMRLTSRINVYKFLEKLNT